MSTRHSATAPPATSGHEPAAAALAGPDATGASEQRGGARSLATSRWYRRLRTVGFVVLGIATFLGVRSAIGDWSEIAGVWREQILLLPIVFAFALIDISLQGVAWIWVFERFGIRTHDRAGAKIFLAGYAGLLMPAQLGRLIRPDALVALGRGRLSQCCKAEAAVFVLDAISVIALFAALVAWLVHPGLAPIGAAAVILPALFLGNQIAERLAGTRLGLPDRFWWNWRSGAVVVIEMVGWAAHGVGFFILVSGLAESIQLWDALFFAPGSAVAGVASGLPGGVLATEGFLGAYLRFNEVGTSNLTLAVSAFRAVTFWIWIPIGWVALVLVRRGARKLPQEARGQSPVEIRNVTGRRRATRGECTAHVDGC